MEPLVFDVSDPKLWEKLRKLGKPDPVFVSPTDTVYGFGTRYGNDAGARRLLDLKGREDDRFIVLARHLDDVGALARMSAVQELIVKRYWPGPITFVLPSRDYPGSKIAVRVPKSELLVRIMDQFGGPILSTSCNRHGEPPVTSAAEALAIFGDRVDFYLEGGERESPASTLVDLTGQRPEILRHGAVAFP